MHYKLQPSEEGQWLYYMLSSHFIEAENKAEGKRRWSFKKQQKWVFMSVHFSIQDTPKWESVQWQQ